MRKGTWVFGVAVLALSGIGVLVHSNWPAERAAARAPSRANQPVPVAVAKATHERVPVRIDALGSVTPIASVGIKARVDTTIVGVHFQDGAHVNKGDLLFTLDCRQIEADMKRVQAVIDGAQATLGQAQRDVKRYTELVNKNALPIVTLRNAETTVNVSRATAESNRAQLENLKVQLGFCTIRAPISGRISMANVKVGNFVRQADSTPMATLIQMSPVYVTFTVPQKDLPEIRQALVAKSASIEVIVPGSKQRAQGRLSMIENTVDPSTGMATLRATMPNTDELLWPGTLVTTEMTLRVDEALVVPTAAVQVSQTGNFVFVVEGNVAHVRQVTVERQFEDETVIKSGLKPGEVVVTDGQLRLRNGAHVMQRRPTPAGPRTGT